jgi:hypothetical protein
MISHVDDKANRECFEANLSDFSMVKRTAALTALAEA